MCHPDRSGGAVIALTHPEVATAHSLPEHVVMKFNPSSCCLWLESGVWLLPSSAPDVFQAVSSHRCTAIRHDMQYPQSCCFPSFLFCNLCNCILTTSIFASSFITFSLSSTLPSPRCVIYFIWMQGLLTEINFSSDSITKQSTALILARAEM